MARPLSSLLLAVLLLPAAVSAQESLSAAARTEIDAAVAGLIAKSGVPSASIAVVRDGRVVYTQAYGSARIEPLVPATTAMRYSIGSISKQFTATAVLMLAEEGKLSLDDKLVRWFPELTRSNEVTVRELLSMTSGYQDFWPQDYVMPMMMNPVTAEEIARRWGTIPLDFEPGTRWQYSNTNYVIAGMVVERVSGMPVMTLLQKRVFGPLGMTTVVDTDQAGLGSSDPQRYLRYAAGPLRPAPKEGRGWMFAAGELAMTAADLAKWDISIIDQKLLQPSSYAELERDVALKSGAGTRYGLGVGVTVTNGRRLLSHGGEVSGFTSRNDVYPDDRAAVVVLTNMDATDASELIAGKIGTLLFAKSDASTSSARDLMRTIFTGLQHGRLERKLLTSNASSYFTDQAIRDFASSLGPLGTPQEFEQVAQSLRGGMTLRRYRIVFPKKTLRLTTFIMPDGSIEQYQIAATD